MAGLLRERGLKPGDVGIMIPTRSPGSGRARAAGRPTGRSPRPGPGRSSQRCSPRMATRPAWARVVSVRFLARFVTLLIASGPGDPGGRRSRGSSLSLRALVRRHNRCAGGGRGSGPSCVLAAGRLLRRVQPGLSVGSTPRTRAPHGAHTHRGELGHTDYSLYSVAGATRSWWPAWPRAAPSTPTARSRAAKAGARRGHGARTPPQRAAYSARSPTAQSRSGSRRPRGTGDGAPVRQAGAFQIGLPIAHLRYFADQARS